MLESVIFAALFTAFVVLFLGKTGIKDKFITDSPKLISELFSCDFCLCFWIGLAFSIGVACAKEDISFIIIPAFSTPIARFLL